ncbi:hypothetical protein JHL21_10290 [Devosia sp. WQ 349]|uniref:hypothetical protein n=1 Tax=Devosia sp. WQ 349K1 TaxID=2800329 RepID=UPI0019043689|nr:hypothetical protein [Devosia sp. WQ 349K1]MBK1794890.1 hypothetical protein [Devosia sp. WQ 349K1]
MRFCFAVFSALMALPAFAQDMPDPAYQDDRSSPQAVVQSLYNAINREEYLRAWSYYGANSHAQSNDTAASADYEAFKAGYEETKAVTLLTGEPTEEGAAGSSYYYLPVAIDAQNHDGTSAQFAGCFTLKLALPTNQDAPPYAPMHIEEGKLEAVESKALDAVLPTDCTPE